MKAGNIQEKFFLEFDYLDCENPPFEQKQLEKRILFRPHQTYSLPNISMKYTPLDRSSEIIELNCVCNRKDNTNIIDKLIEEYSLEENLLWIDPCELPIECFTSIILNWSKSQKPEKNNSLAIPITKGESNNKTSTYILWKPSLSGPIKRRKSRNSIWYPSLSRDKNSLLKAFQYLDPYDAHPILDFSKVIVQPGEIDLTNHSIMLEQTRTRTRNFVYFDYLNPKRTFLDFLEVLQNIPKIGPFVVNPTVTPGGNRVIYLLMAIAGALSESDFLTPVNEIPMTSNREIQGIIVLRKCA
jgi:glycosyltransferase involved in cell wall biosynthesis